MEHGMNIYVTSNWFFKNSKRLISNSTLTNVVLGLRVLPFWDISLEKNWDFVTNKFATSCDYLTFTTIVGYIYNYFLHLKPLATTL
jgi:hypothetical protein